MNPRLPPHVRAVLSALRLGPSALPSLPKAGDWHQALAFADQHQLTLPFRERLIRTGAWEQTPEPVRRRLDRNLADNTLRQERFQAALAEIAGRLTDAGVPFLVLKGLTHVPAFLPDPRLRVQYDIDLYCPPAALDRARDILLELRYEPLSRGEQVPSDHLPPMVRKTGWQWRGDFFDPELPPSVDLHFRFWDPETERLPAPGVGEFWDRRVLQPLPDCGLYQLDEADQLGYAALHVVRHLLRGSLRLFNVYEIALFLASHDQDEAFWTCWRDLHPPELRRLETLALRFAERYFGDPNCVSARLEPLPAGAERWLRRYAWSPVESLFRPNKHELFLHLSLLKDPSDRWRIVRRRLVPRLPGSAEAAFIPKEEITLGLRIRERARHLGFLTQRLIFHARVLLPTLWGLIWWREEGRR